MEDHLLRFFSCRQDTPEFPWFSRTVEDTLYRHCDYKIKQQESWSYHDTQDKKNLLQIVTPFSQFDCSESSNLNFTFTFWLFEKQITKRNTNICCLFRSKLLEYLPGSVFVFVLHWLLIPFWLYPEITQKHQYDPKEWNNETVSYW